MADSTRQGVLFATGFLKPLHVAFDEPKSTSDGGAPLLSALDRSIGLTERMADSLCEWREEGKVRHSLAELLRQRVYSIACGYVDGNDAARLRDDPMHRMLLDRSSPLASQPTISRFENGVSSTDLLRMSFALCDAVIAAQARRQRTCRRITIDLDGTVDPTHGAQQHSLFHGFYDTWCYLPLIGFLSFDDEPEQHLFAALLRRGTAREHEGTIFVVRHAVARLRRAFPKAKILVRLDAGFQSPKVFSLLEDLEVDYLIAVAKNPALERNAAGLMHKARRRQQQSGQSVRLFGETRWGARSWRGRRRRVVYKAEVLAASEKAPKDNPRFVVTTLERLSAKRIYELYCQRGDSENRIKELKHDLQIDRTSCTSFTANQLRVLLTAATYVLYQELRARIRDPARARLQVGSLRLMLIKIGGRLVRSARRLVLHLSAHHPWRDLWNAVARRLGAESTPLLC
jgi:hypothetical protein